MGHQELRTDRGHHGSLLAGLISRFQGFNVSHALAACKPGNFETSETLKPASDMACGLHRSESHVAPELREKVISGVSGSSDGCPTCDPVHISSSRVNCAGRLTGREIGNELFDGANGFLDGRAAPAGSTPCLRFPDRPARARSRRRRCVGRSHRAPGRSGIVAAAKQGDHLQGGDRVHGVGVEDRRGEASGAGSSGSMT